MKINRIIATSMAVLILAGCAPATPTQTEQQKQDAADWDVRVDKIVVTDDPNWIRCSNCSADNAQDTLYLPAGSSFLILTATIVNKSEFTAQVTPFGFGISMASGSQDCARTNETDNFCAVEGYKLGDKLYVPIGNGLFPFMGHFKIAPNAPAGESVEIYFVIKNGAKAATFQFLSLPPVDIEKLNP
jgi:hypothetical protein